MNHNKASIDLVKSLLLEKAMKESTPKKFSGPMYEAAEIIEQLEGQVEQLKAQALIEDYDNCFASVCVSAVRYALGRRTYIVSDVCGFITPLLGILETNTLKVMYKDIADAEAVEGLGDRTIDEPIWMNLKEKIRIVLSTRKEEPTP